MKNYAVLADLRAKATFHIQKAFDRGYDQGYQDGKLDGEAENIEKLEKQLDDEKKAEYKRGYADGKKEVAAELNFEKGYYKGYEDGKIDIVSKAKAEVSQYREGYDKGLKHGQELRAEEVKCAEACGMRKGWETARKILQMTLDEVAKVFDPTWDVEHVIEVMSVSEVITRLDAWEKKQEQNKASCKNCAHGSVKPGKYYDCQILSCDAVPCVIEDGHCDKYEEKQEQTEKNCKECEIYSKALRGKFTVKQIEENCDTCNNFSNVKPFEGCALKECNYEPKQEQNKKTCDTCKLNNLIDGEQYCEILEKYGECDKEDDWIPKQEQKEKNCDNCKYNNREKIAFPCSECVTMTNGFTMWEAKKDYMRDATPEERKSVNNYIKSISEETGVTFNEKEEQTEKSCKTCKSNPPEKKWPCVDCDVSIHDRYEPKQDAPDINDGNIKVGDEVTYNIGNVMVVTRVYSESRSADLLRYDGTVEQQPLEILTPTGKHYDIQALFDAIKPSKPEEGGE